MSAVTDGLSWGEQWQRSWDHQQEGYMPDREQRIGALVDLVEAVAGAAPRVLDLANADDMAPGGLPVVAEALAVLEDRRRTAADAEGRPTWDGWWDIVAGDPTLAPAVDERRHYFRGNHEPSFVPAAEWHVAALAGAGFVESGVAWRSGTGAVVAGVR